MGPLGPDGGDGARLTAYRKQLVRHTGGDYFRLILLVKHVPLPEVSPELLLELWSSPIWDGKQEDITEDIAILKEPVGCVVSGATSPICM